MPGKPELRVGLKDFSDYAKYLKELLLEQDEDTVVKAIGFKILTATELVSHVFRELKGQRFGSVNARYGKIEIGEIEMPDQGIKPSIQIPCRIVREEVEGYRSLINLSQNPWQCKLEIVDKYWREKLENYFPVLADKKWINLYGPGNHVVDAIKVFNILRKRMPSLDVTYQYVELGYRPHYQSSPNIDYKRENMPCIKIAVTAK